MRLLQVLGVEEARFRVVEDPGSQPRPDRVVDGVPQDGRRAEKEEERPEMEDAEPGEAARGEEERVAGQERGDDQSRLQEDDQEEQGVGGGAVPLDDLGQMLIEVKEEVDEPVDEIHVLPVKP